jgi:hypothetical protein
VGLARVLEDLGHPDVHAGFPLGGMVREGEPSGQAGVPPGSLGQATRRSGRAVAGASSPRRTTSS